MERYPSLARAVSAALRLTDAPQLAQQLRFAELRRRYYDLFWHKVAGEIGAESLKWDFGFRRLARGGRMVIVRGAELRLDDHLTLDLMGNKALTYRLIAEQGLAVPRHVRFPVGRTAWAEPLLALGRPLVVKPNSGSGGGRGVTTGITSLMGLRRAALRAARYDTEVLAEEQIEGNSYRLLYLDGRLIDAVKRLPPSLAGDGRSSLRALAARENRRRLAAQPFSAVSPLRLDGDAVNYLAAQGLRPGSVPAAGERIIVKRTCNENTAPDNQAVFDRVNAATAALCARLVTNLGVRLAGVDIIARDIAAPLGPANGLVGEINTTPGLHHHDLVAQPRNGLSVAATIVNHLFETGSGVVTLPSAATAQPILRVAAG
jgi:cyanophycin synthetase